MQVDWGHKDLEVVLCWERVCADEESSRPINLSFSNWSVEPCYQVMLFPLVPREWYIPFWDLFVCHHFWWHVYNCDFLICIYNDFLNPHVHSLVSIYWSDSALGFGKSFSVKQSFTWRVLNDWVSPLWVNHTRLMNIPTSDVTQICRV